MVFQLRRQVESVTSHWVQRRGGLINFKIMGSLKGAILHCEPDKGSGLLALQFPDDMNRLRDANIHCWRAASKEGLTDGQTVDRLAFATRWRDFDWGSVTFSDETSISSDCESGGYAILNQAPDITLAISTDATWEIGTIKLIMLGLDVTCWRCRARAHLRPI